MSNAIIIHGGGLVDPSKYVLMRLAFHLSNLKCFEKIFIGKYSFESLYTPEFWYEYNEHLINLAQNKRGTFFGTCRGIDLSDDYLGQKAIGCLQMHKIDHVIVAGGDGSSRQLFEMSESFEKAGIHLIFPIPLTIDGINGGMSIGIEQAVRETIRQTENIVSTSLETRDEGKFSVVTVTTQGRNRDDILASTLSHFSTTKKVADCSLNDLLLIAVPAGLTTNVDKLIRTVNKSRKRTLLLISEGAKIGDISSKITRKVRSLVVGHPSQSNNQTSESDMLKYDEWIKTVSYIISAHKYRSFCISRNRNTYAIKEIGYYAKLNPRDNQICKLSKEDELLLRTFMIT